MHPTPDPYADQNWYSSTYPNSHANAQPHAHTHPHTDAHSDWYGHYETYKHPHTDTHSDWYGHHETYKHPHTDRHAQSADHDLPDCNSHQGYPGYALSVTHCHTHKVAHIGCIHANAVAHAHCCDTRDTLADIQPNTFRNPCHTYL